jgi:photosystem II stability/assembly factor-like uncharacterized protein
MAVTSKLAAEAGLEPAASASSAQAADVGLKILGFDHHDWVPVATSTGNGHQPVHGSRQASAERYGPRVRHLRPALRRRAVSLGAAAALALGAGVAAMVVHGNAHYQSTEAGPTQVYHSRFTASALPGYSQAAGKGLDLVGGWQLVSYLSTPGWHSSDIGTPPLVLSCPSAVRCYMVAARPVLNSGPGYLTTPHFNLLEVSRDGGVSWTTLSLPADVSITTPLQCPASVMTCYAAGYDAGHVVLLTTTDGGQSWAARRIPGSAYFAAALDCAAEGSCVVLFQTSGWAPGYNLRAHNAAVLVTHDDGLSWSAGPPVPHGQLPDYLACSGRTCVVFDQLITEDNGQSVNGSGPQTVAPGSWAAWYSHDAGGTWQRGQHPGSIWTMASHDLPDAGIISCSDRLHCWAAMSGDIGQPAIATAFAARSEERRVGKEC